MMTSKVSPHVFSRIVGRNRVCGTCGGPWPCEKKDLQEIKAQELLFRLAQAIETYSNDQFKSWPEYQEAIKFFGVEINDS